MSMRIMTRTKVLGSRRRTEILVLLALLDESYPTELARLLGARLFAVQEIVDALEQEGVVATRLMGRIRRVSLDPRFFAYKELRALLLRLAEGEPDLQKLAEGRRARPRRKGKRR